MGQKETLLPNSVPARLPAFLPACPLQLRELRASVNAASGVRSGCEAVELWVRERDAPGRGRAPIAGNIMSCTEEGEGDVHFNSGCLEATTTSAFLACRTLLKFVLPAPSLGAV